MREEKLGSRLGGSRESRIWKGEMQWASRELLKKVKRGEKHWHC